MTWLRWMAATLGLAGAVVGLLVGLMTTASVVGRVAFLAPIQGDVELTTFGIGLAISLCLPWCQYHSSNIFVDFFTTRLSERSNRRLDGIGALLLGIMYLLLTWRTTIGALGVRSAYETTMILELPNWWIYAALAPGLALAALIALIQAARQLNGLPPVPQQASAGPSHG